MTGIIGTGLLGQALVSRLLAAGQHVIGFDIDPERCRQLAEKGAQVASTVTDLASESVILLCLPDSATVASILSLITPSMSAGSCIIDTTTGDPDDSRRAARQLAEQGIEYIDATVAGSSIQVEAGEGVFMIGGNPAAIDRCQHLLDALSPHSFLLGPSGAGATMKLIVNLALGLNRAVLAEALALAEHANVDPRLALEVLRNSPAFSAQMDSKGEKMIARDYHTQARLSQHLKDVELILQLGENSSCPLPLSGQHRTLLQQAIDLGLADQDNSAIIEAWREVDKQC
jgi:3-hydroxyisobutyrate dehydrogenase-like beta-hydroxyacid dehydrogenase